MSSVGNHLNTLSGHLVQNAAAAAAASNLVRPAPDWQTLVIAARNLRDSGDETRALKLYRIALISASKAKNLSRHEFAQFVGNTLWS